MKLRYLIISLVVLLIVLLIGFWSVLHFLPYEPLVTVVVQNQIDETLWISYGDAFVGTSVPGGEVKFKLLAYDPQGEYEVTAKDSIGNVVYTANFTNQDIGGKRIYRVIIPPTAKGTGQSNNAIEK